MTLFEFVITVIITVSILGMLVFSLPLAWLAWHIVDRWFEALDSDDVPDI